MKIKGVNITQDIVNKIYNKITIINFGEFKDCWEYGKWSKKSNYPTIKISNTELRITRVLYQIFHPEENIDDKVICHTCDNRFCVNPNHLFSGTIQDNMNDKISKNRQTKGSDISSSKLSENSIIEILEGIINGKFNSYDDIQNNFDISISSVSSILNGMRWTHITKDYNLFELKNKIIKSRKGTNSPSSLLSIEDVKDIKQRLKNGETGVSISKIYNVSQYVICKINCGRSYQNVQ